MQPDIKCVEKGKKNYFVSFFSSQTPVKNIK